MCIRDSTTTANYTLSVVPVLIPIKVNTGTVCNTTLSNCPANILLTTKSTGAAATWQAPTVSSNCPGVKLTSNYAPGTVFPQGTTAVIYTATDPSGQTTTCAFNVQVSQPLTKSVPDVAVQISGPAYYAKYAQNAFTISATNVGNVPLTNVQIKFDQPQPSTGVTVTSTSLGTYNDYCPGGTHCQTWTIPSLAVGKTALLSLNVYVMDPAGANISAGAHLLSSTPTDANSLNNIGTYIVSPTQ